LSDNFLDSGRTEDNQDHSLTISEEGREKTKEFRSSNGGDEKRTEKTRRNISQTGRKWQKEKKNAFRFPQSDQREELTRYKG